MRLTSTVSSFSSTRQENMVIAQPAHSDSALESVVDDAVRETGFDLEGLAQVRAGRRWLVRVIIDSDDGVGLDDIATVSR
ncbi:MAG: ribosome maturation factor RimP, partial [Actinomycetes bacterium]